MAELYELGLKEAAERLKKKEFSSTELTKAYLGRIAARNDALNAYVTVCEKEALEMASASDKRLKEGNARLIEGVPLGIKDLFCTKDVQTTACSKILKGFIPPYESTVTQNLWNGGGVMLGKTNMDEFAMGSSNETSCFGSVANPWDEERTSGGSSGGSASAVADFLCPAATGSDTGGSIRQPASFSGIVGLKPTYGRCSRWGMVSYASSLDQAGPFARSVEDVALMFRVMSGFDHKDSTSADMPIEPYDEALNDFSVKGLKIGLPREYFVEGMNPDVRKVVDAAVARFEKEGAEIVQVSLPHTKYAVPTYYIVSPAEASSNLARYDGMRYGLRVEGDSLMDTYVQTRTAGFGDEVKRRIMIGNYTLSSGSFDAFYAKAQRVRSLIAKDFEEVFKKVDILLTPTTPSIAFKVGEKVSDPIQMYLNDIYTVATSLAGLPGISLPAGMVENMPVGIQLIGKAFDERFLLRAAHAHEKLTQFEMRKPSL